MNERDIKGESCVRHLVHYSTPPPFSPLQIVRKTFLEERVSRLKSEKSWLQTFTASLVIFIIIIIIIIIFTADWVIIIVCIKVLKRYLECGKLVLKNASSYYEALLFQS